VLIGITYSVLCGYTCAILAYKIERNINIAYVIGFIVGIVGLLGYYIYYRYRKKDAPLHTVKELIAEAEKVQAQKRADENLREIKVKRVKKEILILIALFIVFSMGSVFIYGFIQGYTSSTFSTPIPASEFLQASTIVPKYCTGDIVGNNVSEDTQSIILGYDENLDEYENTFVTKIEDEWVYILENDTSFWEDRETLEEYYPIKIYHVDDLSMLISFDEYYEEEQRRILNDTIKKIPQLAQCYNTIKSKETLIKELQFLNISGYYQENRTDCSEMSAYLEWWLESHGVHAYIITGSILPHPEIYSGRYVYEADEGGQHAWVEAEIKGENVSIESTDLFIIPDELKPYYEEKNRFENLEELFRSRYEEGYDIQSEYDEFNWWEELPKKFIYIN
jgi:hypothetical protein